MTVEQLMEMTRVNKRSWDYEVVIPNSIPSMGPRATVNVKYVNPGFDWDSGKFFIVPEHAMIKKETNEE